MSGCPKCKGRACACGARRDDGLPTSVPREGPIYVVSKSIVVQAGQAEQSVFKLPPAAAVDIFIQFRDPVTATTVDNGDTAFSIYATQQLLSYRIDRNHATSTSSSNRRVLAVRDLPVDGYELKADGLDNSPVDGVVGYYDVVAIGWGHEPTSLGPLPLTEWTDGVAIPNEGRNIGVPMMVVDRQGRARLVFVDNTTIHQPDDSTSRGDMNVLPVAQFLDTFPTRTDDDLGPLTTDNTGALRVTTSTTGSTPASSRFVSAAYEKSHVRNTPSTLKSAFLSSKAGTAGFLFIFDAAALPIDGTVPDFPPIPVPAGGFVSVEFPEGRPMANGIVLALSSTQATLTLFATSDGWFEAHF